MFGCIIDMIDVDVLEIASVQEGYSLKVFAFYSSQAVACKVFSGNIDFLIQHCLHNMSRYPRQAENVQVTLTHCL